MEKRRERSRASVALRWSARGLGLLIAGFFLFMFIGESIGSPGDLGRIRPLEAVGLGLRGLYIAGMLVALRWERTGVLLALAALTAFFLMLAAGAIGRGGAAGVLNPFMLAMWIPLVLYRLCWTLEGGAPRAS